MLKNNTIKIFLTGLVCRKVRCPEFGSLGWTSWTTGFARYVRRHCLLGCFSQLLSSRKIKKISSSTSLAICFHTMDYCFSHIEKEKPRNYFYSLQIILCRCQHGCPLTCVINTGHKPLQTKGITPWMGSWIAPRST